MAGVHGGLKAEGKLDVALVVSDVPCSAAGVFTTNLVKAAPVLYDQQTIAKRASEIRAVVTNSGCANACTGILGMQNAIRTAEIAAQALGCDPDQVLVLSTGVIGVQLNMDAIQSGITAGAQALDASAWPTAAQAIMTTDTRPKLVSFTTDAGYTITGIAKGAGMIAPNMATMLSVIVTDAKIAPDALNGHLNAAANKSFNRIVVDGDMSTNDTVLLLANGASGIAPNPTEFAQALETVSVQLAQSIVRDGEGATKFVTIEVVGAASEDDARQIAHSIATSPLCKTAFYGGDPNWGRVLAAAGYAGIEFDPDTSRLWLLDAANTSIIQLVESGQPCDYDEPAAIALMQQSEFGFRLEIGAGASVATIWTCDFSHEYVTVNGHYRT